MAAVAVAAGIHHQGLAGPGPHRHGLMAKAPQPAVFYGRLGRLARIQFHHPAIFIARQAKGIAEALQPLAIEAEGALRRQRRGAVGIHLLHHMGVDVFLRR